MLFTRCERLLFRSHPDAVKFMRGLTQPVELPSIRRQSSRQTRRLCDELDNTAGLLDLLLGLSGEVAGANDDGDLGEAALAEDLGVAEVEQVEDGGLGAVLLGEVLLALLSGDERPELVEVDDGLPEVVLLLVEVAHTVRVVSAWPRLARF